MAIITPSKRNEANMENKMNNLENNSVLDDNRSLTETLSDHKTYTFASGASLYLSPAEARQICIDRQTYIVSES